MLELNAILAVTDFHLQARELYKISMFHPLCYPRCLLFNFFLDKVRSLYDRSQTTARLVVRSRRDLEKPLVSYC